MWVFGYGSLMWDGWEKKYDCRRTLKGRLAGYRRDFNKASVKRWGTNTAPGPTLGLECDSSGACVGTAFEFPDEQESSVLESLRQREGQDFELRQLTIRFSLCRSALAYVPINRVDAAFYLGARSLQERAAMVSVARGEAGACLDYVKGIRQKLHELGVDDRPVEEFWAAVQRHGAA